MYNPFNQPYGYPQMPQLQPVNNFRQPYTQPQYTQPQFVVKQVTNIEEARASMIDPLSTYLFVDTSTGYIYLKRLNNNGLSDFYKFKAEETAGTEKLDPLDSINQRLSNIERLIGGNYDKSIPDNANVTEPKPDGYAAAPKPESPVVHQSPANGAGQVRSGVKADGKQYR